MFVWDESKRLKVTEDNKIDFELMTDILMIRSAIIVMISGIPTMKYAHRRRFDSDLRFSLFSVYLCRRQNSICNCPTSGKLDGEII